MSKIFQARIVEEGDKTFAIMVQRDGRFRKTIRWTVQEGLVTVRVPTFMDDDAINQLLDDEVIPSLREQRKPPKKSRRSRRKRSKRDRRKRVDATPPPFASEHVPPRTIQVDGETLIVEVERDGRLRKSIRWTMREGLATVRVPKDMSDDEVNSFLDNDLIPKIRKQRERAAHLNDDELDARAKHLNRTYFDDESKWHTIRWVTNMRKRLGSVTLGGSTDGDIRISHRIREWPPYVVDYVIAHELAHRLYPGHSADFWAYLARYPHLERARGFIEGIAYAEGGDADDLL